MKGSTFDQLSDRPYCWVRLLLENNLQLDVVGRSAVREDGRDCQLHEVGRTLLKGLHEESLGIVEFHEVGRIFSRRIA